MKKRWPSRKSLKKQRLPAFHSTARSIQAKFSRKHHHHHLKSSGPKYLSPDPNIMQSKTNGNYAW